MQRPCHHHVSEQKRRNNDEIGGDVKNETVELITLTIYEIAMQTIINMHAECTFAIYITVVINNALILRLSCMY